MATVTVLHRKSPESWSGLNRPVEFTAVALVNVPPDEKNTVNEILEYAYRWTQNIQGSWSMKQGPDANHHVQLIGTLLYDEEGKQYGLRSTSMDDLLVLEDKIYRVAMAGFEESKV